MVAGREESQAGGRTVAARGEIWWATLRGPRGSEPGYRRPVLVLQSDAFNRSRIRTVVALVITSNLRLAEAPGNLLLTPKQSGLPKPSAVNVSQIVTFDRTRLTDKAGKLKKAQLRTIEDGVRLVLSL